MTTCAGLGSRYAVGMPRELIVPAILMSLALVFYSAGVWGERLQRYLHTWHVVAFWLGLTFDFIASELMVRLLPGALGWDVHLYTGAAALLLMAGHAVWATVVRMRGSESARAGFHRYSLVVWCVWLVPYTTGMIAGIVRGSGG